MAENLIHLLRMCDIWKSSIDVSWFYNGKLIKPHPNIKIRIKEGNSSCVISEVTQEMAGEYSCKATSSLGSTVTKANLQVSGIYCIIK